MDYVRPAPIRTDESNTWARYSMFVRAPKIIEETQALNPDYPEPVQQALARLRESLLNNEQMPMLDLPAPDYDDWAVDFADHAGETWLNTDWFAKSTAQSS